MTPDKPVLPVPVRFALPGAEWTSVPPESRGVHGAVFLAVRDTPDGDYAPTISVSGNWRTAGESVEQIADESLVLLRAQADDVELVARKVAQSAHAPAVVQTLGAVLSTAGRTYDLRQEQVVAGYVDVADPTRQAVIVYTLTCTYAQFGTAGREFQQFMSTVQLVTGGEVQPA